MSRRKARKQDRRPLPPPRAYCWASGKSKIVYTREQAYAALNKQRRLRVQLRVYQCPRFTHYHLTSQPPRKRVQ